jgi:transporter family-2 protein
VPKIGLGNAIFFVLLGQLAAAAIIDHFGLFGASVSPISLRRSFGLAVMAAGVFLSRKDLFLGANG